MLSIPQGLTASFPMKVTFHWLDTCRFNSIIILYFWKFWYIWEFVLKLTRRQEDFINNLLDLYREMEGPIHYSVLAERLGVSPFTAYDMLRLLEEKGLVSSEYYLPSDK